MRKYASNYSFEFGYKSFMLYLSKKARINTTDLMGIDQYGFIQQRMGFHNVQRVLNILHEQRGGGDIDLIS